MALLPIILPNILNNACGDVWRRQEVPTTLTSYNDDSYGPDRWKLLTESASVQMAQVAGPTDPWSLNAIRIKQNQASAQRAGIIQFIDNHDSISYRGIPLRLEARINISNSQAIHYAVLEWTGTADIPTTDVVNNWTSGSYTPGNFFLGSDVTVISDGTILPGANAWTSFFIDCTPDAACNNLAVFIWSEGTMSQNTTLDFSQLHLHQGQIPATWNGKSESEEIEDCGYFCNSWFFGTAVLGYGQVDATNEICLMLPVPEMRIYPAAIMPAPANFMGNDGSSNVAANSAFINGSTLNLIRFCVTQSGNTWTVGRSGCVFGTSSAFLILDSDF